MRPPSTPRPLLRRTFLCTTGVFLVLQIWRPYFFLTDDNLSAALPFFTEMGRHLKSGQSPFYSDYLFGGHYNLLRDANYFGWSPVNFLVSLLADTPGRFAMCDILAYLNLLLSATGFVVLASALRAELNLQLSDGRILFLALSFTYSTFILTTGASWVNFMANQSVQPWLVLGLWQLSWRRALGLLVLFSLYQALTGHTAGVISNGICLTLFALVLCAWRRNLRPLAYWIAASALTLLIIAPILLPAMGGFVHSQRSQGLSVELLNRFAMPAALFPTSFLFGNYFEMAAYLAHISAPNFFLFPRLPTLLACAAAWCVFPLVCQRRRWTLLETGCGVLIALLVLMVIRPLAITQFMSHLPVLRSMRWPFREILQLLFFYHLLLAIRPWAGSSALQNRVACFSLALFVLPLFFTRPLTFNALAQDRAALLSGKGDRFWQKVKTYLRPGDEIATIIDPDAWYRSIDQLSYSYAGTADFPAYFRVPCISGYSQTAPVNQLPISIRPYFWFGAYDPAQLALLTKENRVRIITITQIDPLHLKLSAPAKGQAPVDLTPLLSGK